LFNDGGARRSSKHYIKFPCCNDVPACLAAVTAVPGAVRFVALYVLSGVMDLAIWRHDAKKEAGYFGYPVVLVIYRRQSNK
jgi:hypothetical protein